mmetsp:Transcript_1080/g.1246  ORF Transcript_1080/g.1246 Transcript_1080/m.1246 type:complete len:117 (+) Transcript_1080:222-572(+)
MQNELKAFEATITIESLKEEAIRHDIDDARFADDFESQQNLQRDLVKRLERLKLLRQHRRRDRPPEDDNHDQPMHDDSGDDDDNDDNGDDNGDDDNDDNGESGLDVFSLDWRAKRT